MIENKIITITKQNNFDKGWALFSPQRERLFQNVQFKPIESVDLVRQITYASEIVLVLAKATLSSNILQELKWANKYVKPKIVAKEQAIVDKYNFAAELVKIDFNVNCNAISITSKYGKNCYLLDDGITQIDDTVENFFLGKNSSSLATKDIVKDADEAYLFVDEKTQVDFDLLEFFEKNGISNSLIIPNYCYSKELYTRLKDISTQIVVAEQTTNVIVYKKSGKLFLVKQIGNLVVSGEIRDCTAFIHGALHKCLKLPVALQGEEIPTNALFVDKTVTPLQIAKEKVVERVVPILTMADFVAEKFDASETELHNQYCTQAQSIRYVFTLVPPLIDDKYKLSSIYSGAKELHAQWFVLRKNRTKAFKSEIVNLFGTNNGFVRTIDLLEEIDGYLKETVERNHYHAYKYCLGKYVDSITKDVNSLFDYCAELFSFTSQESENTQFSKIDKEIIGYKSTIVEKQRLIDEGKDVLQNKRRIEILQDKIAYLTELKKGFIQKSDVRTSDATKEFVQKCKLMVAGTFSENETDSVANIINTNTLSKAAQLELLLKNNLPFFSKLLDRLLEILKAFKEIDVPEDYVVYEKEPDSRYIVIEELKDYEATLSLQQQYNLQCVTRRN